MASLRVLVAIVGKDLLLEFRTRQALPTMVVLGMLITWIFNLVGEVGSIPASTLGAAALWIAFLFAGMQVQERSFAVEQSQGCLFGLLLAPVDAGSIYLAKLLFNVLVLSIFEAILVPLVLVMFNLQFSESWWSLLLVLLLGNVAISSVGTLFSAMLHVAGVHGALLSVLVLIILLPVMIPATFSLLLLFGALPPELIGTGALAIAGTLNNAVGFLVVFDAVFVTANWLLFGFVVQES